MNTDTQHMAYVLRTSQGEQNVPEGLKQGLKKANRMQDINLEKMKAGKTGNEVLKVERGTIVSVESLDSLVPSGGTARLVVRW